MNFVLLDSEPDILEQKESIEKKPDSGHKNMNILCGSEDFTMKQADIAGKLY